MAQFSLKAWLLRLYHAISDLNWWVLLAVLLVHMAGTWLLMYFVSEEPEFERLPTFIYWYATTASTIGYGDVTPKTDEGRLINALFVYPGAIAIFTTIVTKFISGASDRVRRARIGMGDYRELSHAIVLVGYDPDRTPRMLDELCADAEPGQQIVLLTRKEFENSDPRLRYVRARSLTSIADLERAGVPDADRVIIFSGNDTDTLAAGLAIADLNRRGHIVCYFEDAEIARLLSSHCDNVEVVMAPAVELVVRAVKDPGSSQLLSDLVSHTDEGMTLFSMPWTGPQTIGFRALAERLLGHGAVLVSYRPLAEAGQPCVFRFAQGEVGPGDRLFYIAGQRLRPESLGAPA
jgi:voltage-gated potassium channel